MDNKGREPLPHSMLHNGPSENVKSVRREYEYKILELQNELAFLREEVGYKQEVHDRELENMKALFEYEYTVKVREIRNGLRDQYEGHLAQNEALISQNNYLHEELRLMKLKIDRSEKYSKEVETLCQQKLAKECITFQQKIKSLENALERHKKQTNKENEEFLKAQRIKFLKEKSENQQTISELRDKIAKLESQNEDLKKQITIEIVEREEMGLEKDKLIEQQAAKIEVLRQNSIYEEMAAKKSVREARLKELDANILQSFQNSERNLFSTIDVYRTDLQRQILLEKQMKKRWQTQTCIKPQIRRVVGRRKKLSSDSIGHSRRQASVPDSPRFGQQY